RGCRKRADVNRRMKRDLGREDARSLGEDVGWIRERGSSDQEPGQDGHAIMIHRALAESGDDRRPLPGPMSRTDDYPGPGGGGRLSCGLGAGGDFGGDAGTVVLVNSASADRYFSAACLSSPRS